MKIRTEKVIDVSEWDALVQNTYNRPYNFQQQNGCRDRGLYGFKVSDKENYDFEKETVPEDVNGEIMGVSFEAWLERNPKQPIKDQKYDWERTLWWERNFYPAIEMVANDLHEKGLLEAGEYMINIDW